MVFRRRTGALRNVDKTSPQDDQAAYLVQSVALCLCYHADTFTHLARVLNHAACAPQPDPFHAHLAQGLRMQFPDYPCPDHSFDRPGLQQLLHLLVRPVAAHAAYLRPPVLSLSESWCLVSLVLTWAYTAALVLPPLRRLLTAPVRLAWLYANLVNDMFLPPMCWCLLRTAPPTFIRLYPPVLTEALGYTAFVGLPPEVVYVVTALVTGSLTLVTLLVVRNGLAHEVPYSLPNLWVRQVITVLGVTVFTAFRGPIWRLIMQLYYRTAGFPATPSDGGLLALGAPSTAAAPPPRPSLPPQPPAARQPRLWMSWPPHPPARTSPAAQTSNDRVVALAGDLAVRTPYGNVGSDGVLTRASEGRGYPEQLTAAAAAMAAAVVGSSGSDSVRTGRVQRGYQYEQRQQGVGITFAVAGGGHEQGALVPVAGAVAAEADARPPSPGPTGFGGVSARDVGFEGRGADAEGISSDGFGGDHGGGVGDGGATIRRRRARSLPQPPEKTPTPPPPPPSQQQQRLEWQPPTHEKPHQPLQATLASAVDAMSAASAVERSPDRGWQVQVHDEGAGSGVVAGGDGIDGREGNAGTGIQAEAETAEAETVFPTCPVLRPPAQACSPPRVRAGAGQGGGASTDVPASVPLPSQFSPSPQRQRPAPRGATAEAPAAKSAVLTFDRLRALALAARTAPYRPDPACQLTRVHLRVTGLVEADLSPGWRDAALLRMSAMLPPDCVLLNLAAIDNAAASVATAATPAVAAGDGSYFHGGA